jgi:LacI family transcriptional regulator
VVYLLMDWYEHEINRGVSDYARQANWILEDASAHATRLNPEWTGHGIIVLGIRRNDRVKIDFIRKRKIPAVDLINESAELVLPRVLPDNYEIGRMAAKHFLSRGFENLAYYQAFDANVERERMRGFLETAVAAGKSFSHVDLSKHPRLKGNKRIARLGEKLKKLPAPIGIMGQYDYSAKELIYACEAAGISVPEQVAVVGVDNDPISCELGPVTLTSVDSNLYGRGWEAAALLDRLMKGEPPPDEPIRIPPKGIIVRQSSDILAVGNTSVAKGLRFIWANINKNIKTNDVVKASGISRTMLYNLFKKHLRTSLKDIILTERINRVKELLMKTGEKMDVLAAETGFLTGNRLSKTFKRQTGISPYAFRKQEKSKDVQGH